MGCDAATVRQLVPRFVDVVDVAEVVAAEARVPTGDRPWVVVNMIATVDGGTAVGGVSGPLGGPADKAVFAALRGVADIVLVAAGTARAEDYRPARARADGSPGPRIAVVTRSGALDPASRLFQAGAPLVITCAACPPDRRAALEAVAEVVVAGDDDVDLEAALRALPAAVVLCEGGPTLNGQLVAAGLVDEWCLTLSPLLAGGGSKRVAVGPDAAPLGLRLDRLLEDGGFAFLRYVRA
jgi:riboflavin biosynthesis pyrimidine reductase